MTSAVKCKVEKISATKRTFEATKKSNELSIIWVHSVELIKPGNNPNS